MLTVSSLHSGYGHIEALHGIDLTVPQGSIVTLIGANGAGKTTLLSTICGQPRATKGRILFEGKDITRLPTHEIARMGLAHCPEGRHVFPRMTVLENLHLGATPLGNHSTGDDLDKILDLFPRLRERLPQRAGTLSGGEQQMLAIGRALMSRPRLLLLDEPSLGLAPLIVRQIFELIETINRTDKITILLVEQNAYHGLKLAHYGHVLVQGRVALSGSGAELLANPEIRGHYLEGGLTLNNKGEHL
jgi:branched-chain amino acid transport system ATP-binding protein